MKKRVIPKVTSTSSFADLTTFLSFSFQETERQFVEHILVTREKALLDDLNKTKRDFQNFKQERDQYQNKLRIDLDLSRENNQKFEVLERENRDLQNKNDACNEKQKMMEEILVKREKELKDEVEKIDIFEKMFERKTEKYEEELKKERNSYEKKLSLAEKEKTEFGNELRNEFERRITLLKGGNRDLLKRNEVEKRKLYVAVSEKLELEKGLKKSMMQNEEERRELKEELEKAREMFEKDLKQERDCTALLKKEIEDMIQKRAEFEEGMKEKYDALEQKSELKRRILEEEMESLRDKCEELMVESGVVENMLSLANEEKRVVEDEIRIQREMMENQNDVLQKGFKEELGKMRECHNKELERIHDLMKKKLSVGVSEKLELEKELKKSRIQNEEARKELEKARENHGKELKRERDLSENKLSLAAMEKTEFVNELRKEFEERIELLERESRGLQKENEGCNVKLKMMEEILVKHQRELEDEVEKREIHEKELIKNKLSIGGMEKSELERELRKEFEVRIEVLEGENRELRKKIELLNESVGSGNADADRGSGNHSDGRVVSMSDSHDKASNFKSCPTKSQASPRNISSKTPQVESRGSEGITIGAQLEEGGGCSEKDIDSKRKRRLDETEGDKHSPLVHKKTEGLTESGCKKRSLPNDKIRKLNKVASKANSPPQVISPCVKQCKDKNWRNENSELHFPKPISGVADGKRCSRGDSHEASPVNKAVAGCQSDKKIGWKHPDDMLSAFENDLELCMNVVCALYRAGLSEKRAGSTGFSWTDTVSGTTVAKYLINDDPANKLSRSVLEVQDNRPSILRSCQRLAIKYKERLFKIYQKELDPFF